MKETVMLFISVIILLIPGILYFAVIDIFLGISLTKDHVQFEDALISYAISFGVLLYLYCFWKGVNRLFPEWQRRFFKIIR